MILYNKKKISRVLYNKHQISKILYNKKSLYTKNLNSDDYNGYLNFKLPEINGISDYFMFVVFSHTPIVETSKNEMFEKMILSLAQGKTLYDQESLDTDYIEYSNLKINSENPNTFLGAFTENYVNGANSLNFLYGSDRISSSGYENGVVSFYEGSHTHVFPNEVLSKNFSICGSLGKKQLFSGLLIGQKIIDNADTFEQLKTVTSDISIKIDNNLFVESAYDLYGYCIFNDGEYYLTFMGGSYDPQTNILSYNQNIVLFDSVWFDALPET